jgi:hypothetical protein
MKISPPSLLADSLLIAIFGLVALPVSLQADPREMPPPHTAANPGAYMKALRNEALRDAIGKGAAGNLPGQPRPETVDVAEEMAKEAPKHADIDGAFKRALRENPMKNLPPKAGEGDAEVAAPVDLIASSDILCHRGKATFVPKRSILVRPRSLEGRLALVKNSQIVTWADFFKLNRDWIKTIEVTRVQAEGGEPLSEDAYEMLEGSKILVVATYKGGPISMLPLKAPVNPEDPTASRAESTESIR